MHDHRPDRQRPATVAERTDEVVAEPDSMVAERSERLLMREAGMLATGDATSAVQRRETHAASVADVGETAALGVRGPGGPLPHFDRIQASFGRHDVSHVESHVGGDATAASNALGARAYATGGQVAFAAPPDLHTTAHEAAHTIQQRSGAVAFKGLGSSNDSHEQHADAVADAVVEGRSAEPLLDEVEGTATSGASSSAVQRDEAKKVEVTESDRDLVIYTNIVAAQNELDEVLKYLVGTKKPDAKHIEHKLVRASLYLMEAQETLPLGSRTSEKIAAAIASFNGAETKVANALYLLDDEAIDGATKDTLDNIGERQGAIMRHFGVPGGAETQAKYKSTLGRGKDGAKPETEAMKASLRLAELEAARGFQALVAVTGPFETRVTIIKNTAQLVHGHLGHTSTMMWTDMDDAQRKALKPAVEATSKQILLIKRWIDGRQGNAKMVAAFSDVLAVTNGTRERVGLDAVDLDATEGFPEREEAEETLEQGKMDQAVRDYTEAWESLYEAMDEGVEQWYELAKKSEQNKPSFGQQLLTALITAAAGNFGGIIAKGLFEVADDDAVMAAIADLVSGVTSDSSQSIVGPAIGEAVSGAGDDVDLKALLFVRGGLKEICRKLKSQHVLKVSEQVAGGHLSITQVHGLEDCARRAQKTAMTRLKIQSATDWVRYVAQAGMGGKQATSSDSNVSSEVTDLGGYYGTYHPGGARQAPYRAGNHEGNAGMLRVEVMTYEHSITGPASGLVNITKLDVNKLNKEMAELILSGGDVRTLDDVKVPKEVHVKYKVFKGRATYVYPTLKMVIDEAGNVQASLPEEDAPTDTSVWQEIRKAPISSSMAK